ncbi:MAG: DUF4388 domain-containing protein [Polyangiaceae bacterium]|nr:DUF4388 domain-containing protein [Polyangiaceae bacterium]
MSAGASPLLDKLVSEEIIRPEQREASLNWMARTGDRVEEALLETEAIEEADLLRYLAAQHKTRFVSTEKLAKAEIDRSVLDKLPRKVAERSLVFPVLYAEATGTLSVVTPDPDDIAVLDNVRAVSGVKQVQAFVGRPKAIAAAIAKTYGGDIHAFAKLDRAARQQFSTMMDVFERRLLSEESIVTSLAHEGTSRERTFSAEDMNRSAQGRAVTGSAGGVEGTAYLETLNVLISLVENSRPDLRGHSAQVARLVKKLCERLRLSDAERTSAMIAAYVHDLGKMGAYHLTALNVADYEGHRASASKQYKAPSRLVESIQLPNEVLMAVENMYERYDAQGLPRGIGGKEIPLGARILAIADTYADLTQNPKNPYRKTLRPAQACEVLATNKGKIFDPNLVDLFKLTVTGEDLKARLLADRRLALIIDPDPEETTVLELRLVERGFEVKLASTSEQALKILEAGGVEIVCSELDIKPQDGLQLLEHGRKQRWGQKLPWIIMSGRAVSADAQRAFELGASDVVAKPVSAELLVAKMKQLIEQSAAGAAGSRGVSGSLQEMSLPDIVQVLWHGRKTGSLKIQATGERGEIHFVDGAIYNAMWAKVRGADAFYAMISLNEGEFSLEPSFRAPQQVIKESPEALLLEGMRRLDEGAR